MASELDLTRRKFPGFMCVSSFQVTCPTCICSTCICIYMYAYYLKVSKYVGQVLVQFCSVHSQFNSLPQQFSSSHWPGQGHGAVGAGGSGRGVPTVLLRLGATVPERPRRTIHMRRRWSHRHREGLRLKGIHKNH